jgi:hypothetical protein
MAKLTIKHGEHSHTIFISDNHCPKPVNEVVTAKAEYIPPYTYSVTAKGVINDEK